ncbi:MAG TPA: nitroreductase/quinone reductase family protein, partial [Bacillota bacterium]|nr:nitroreductase/quinone reductase family protein [Bacillota bacterium]
MWNRFGATPLGVWMIKNLASPFQRWLYQFTAGKAFQRGRSRNILLLTTKGRRTGKDRITPVYYLQDGNRFVVCNVNPGFERTNPWVLNLRAYPIAELQIGKTHYICHAREANAEELHRYWPQLLKIWP